MAYRAVFLNVRNAKVRGQHVGLAHVLVISGHFRARNDRFICQFILKFSQNHPVNILRLVRSRLLESPPGLLNS